MEGGLLEASEDLISASPEHKRPCDTQESDAAVTSNTQSAFRRTGATVYACAGILD